MNLDLLKCVDINYVITKLEEMVAIPSVVKRERDLALYLKDELDALGLATELH